MKSLAFSFVLALWFAGAALAQGPIGATYGPIIVSGGGGNTGVSATLTATNTTGTDVTLGNTTSTSTATPVLINMGGTFAATTNCAQAKLWLFRDTGTGCGGLGFDGSGLFYGSAGAAYIHRFYVNDTLSTQITAGQILTVDGTSGAPAYSFTSEPGLGLRRASAGAMTLQGTLTVTGNFSAVLVGVNGQTYLQAPTDGNLILQNSALTIGSKIKVDALPTVASGFGTTPSVTAGSTPLAGSVNVGTGASSSGVINFNGTAFPSAPFVVCMDDSTLLAVRCTATTTQLTITAAAFTASDIISWIAISSK